MRDIFPLNNDSVDMVFIDSPYGDNVKYNDEPENIGNISAEDDEFYDALGQVAGEFVQSSEARKGTRLAYW